METKQAAQTARQHCPMCLRYHARRATRRAIRRGELVKPAVCDRCGSKWALQAHHESYEPGRWLEITWLCQRCHAKSHRGPNNNRHADRGCAGMEV